MSSAQPTLCPIVEGVTFTFTHQGRTVRGLVLSDLLEDRLGADPGPAGWMRCFREHESQLVEAARHAHLEEPTRSLALVREDRLQRQATLQR